ncbi:hypothetical protein ACHWQZ_G009994 [Mnemiopsis leidyi]
MNFSTSMDRPSALSCYDCVVSTWSFIVNDSGPCGGTFEIQFCPAHKRDFRAPPVPNSAAPNSITRLIIVQPPIPGADTRLIPVRRNPSGSGTSSAAVTIPTSGPPRSRYRPSSCEACVSLYNTVKDAVLSSTNATSLRQALDDLNIPKRTFNRKRPVAELYLLDQQAFERARDDIAAASGGRRINQEKLAKQCSDILKRPDMQVKRRVAVTQGLLI